MAIAEGANQLIQPQGAYYRVQWRREGGQPLPSGVYQNGNALQLTNARPDQSGVYLCELVTADGTPVTASYEIRVRPTDRPPLSGGKCLRKEKSSENIWYCLFQVVHQESVLNQRPSI